MAARIHIEEPELPFPPTSRLDRSPFGTFDACPLCGAAMMAEHAHFRCSACGWRDSCCD